MDKGDQVNLPEWPDAMLDQHVPAVGDVLEFSDEEFLVRGRHWTSPNEVTLMVDYN